MSDSDPDDVPQPDTDAGGTPTEPSSRPGEADNSGAVEANRPNPDLPLIDPVAD